MRMAVVAGVALGVGVVVGAWAWAADWLDRPDPARAAAEVEALLEVPVTRRDHLWTAEVTVEGCVIDIAATQHAICRPDGTADRPWDTTIDLREIARIDVYGENRYDEHGAPRAISFLFDPTVTAAREEVVRRSDVLGRSLTPEEADEILRAHGVAYRRTVVDCDGSTRFQGQTTLDHMILYDQAAAPDLGDALTRLHRICRP